MSAATLDARHSRSAFVSFFTQHLLNRQNNLRHDQKFLFLISMGCCREIPGKDTTRSSLFLVVYLFHSIFRQYVSWKGNENSIGSPDLCEGISLYLHLNYRLPGGRLVTCSEHHRIALCRTKRSLGLILLFFDKED